MSIRASVGSYYTTTSPIHALDARVKLICTLIYMLSCLFVDSIPTLVLAATAMGCTIVVSKVPPRQLLGQLKPLVLFLIITSLINLFLVQTGPLVLQLGPLLIHGDGVSAALLYTLRFFLLLLAGSLLTLTTTPVAISDAAEKLLSPFERLGVPVSQVSLVLTIALRFVPTLSQEAEHIVAAQTARGAELENKGALAYARACVPLVVPLFASALRHADNLSRAMDARCYTGGKRTHYHVLRLNAQRDYPALAALLLYVIALIALKLFA